MGGTRLKNRMAPEVSGYEHKPQWSPQEDSLVKPVHAEKEEQTSAQLRAREEQVHIHRLHKSGQPPRPSRKGPTPQHPVRTGV